MMTPRHTHASTSTMVLIIPLIVSTIFGLPQEQRASVANAPKIVYRHDHIGSASSAGHLPWLSSTDICSSHFGVAGTNDSSVLLLMLLVSLPGSGDRPLLHHRGRNTEVNRTVPWTSLPLEPGLFGVPRVGEAPVCSYAYALNVSLNVGFFSIIEQSRVSRHIALPLGSRLPLGHRVGVGAPAFSHDFVFRRFDDNSSFIDWTVGGDGNSSFIDRRYKRRVSRYMASVRAAPRKLLGGHGTNRIKRRNSMVHKKREVTAATAAAIAVGLALLSLFCTVAGLVWCKRRILEDERPILPADLCPWGPRRYSHREVAAATRRFTEEHKIGHGGFGPVYRGYLSDQNRHVAIKVLSQGSSVQAQGMREFQAEVKVMTRLRHRNIVQLLGWCDGPGGLMLVYEFVPHGSLDKHLYDPQSLLTWSDRYKVALGVGSGILYLHTECEQCVLHGDIKPANILLDTSCNAKLGDFGLARLVDHGTDSRTTQVVAGTLGYMDPEFVNNRRPSADSDIYSFGVVLLEIGCGRRPTSTQSNGTPGLLNWVRDMYRKNSILGVADRRLDGEFDDQQMRRLLVAGLWCTHHDPSQRPSIAQAMDILRRQDAELPVLPAMHSPDVVRSLEEVAYGDLPAEDSLSSADTAYHTSKDSSTHLLEC